MTGDHDRGSYASHGTVGTGRFTARRGRWQPPLALPVLLLPLLGAGQVFSDPGIGWHLKMGAWLLRTRQLPARDPFSYTMPDVEWLNYQWLAEVMMASLERLGGVPLVGACCLALLGWIPLLLIGRSQAEAQHVLVGWLIGFLVWQEMTMHVLARPQHRRRGSARSWWAVATIAALGSPWIAPNAYGRFERESLGDSLIAHIESSDWSRRRIFNEVNVGGSLIYRFGPALSVFVDDRADLYRDAFVLGAYLPIVKAQPGWENLLQRYGVDTVLVSKHAALAHALAASPGWTRTFADSTHDVFVLGAQ